MLSWLNRRRHRLRDHLSHRQIAQDVVEFGLAVAAVGLVCIVGFNAISGAEQEYWHAIGPKLAPTPPATGSFLRSTSADISCDHSTLLVGKPTNCTVTISDTDPSTPKQTPQGTVAISTDNGFTTATCPSLMGISPPTPPTSVTCAITWIPQPTDVGPRTLTPVYSPTDGSHATPAHPGVQVITVQPVIRFNGGCSNFYYGGSGVEPGHPLLCTASPLDASGSKPFGQPLDITWTPQPRAGDTFLYCASNSACNSATPVKDGTIACHSDPGTNNGACSIVFRRSFDDNTSIATGGESLTVSAYPTDNPSDNAGSIGVSIIQAKDSHPVQSLTSCTGTGVNSMFHTINAYPSSLDPQHANKLQLKTTQQLDMPSGTSITCQLVIFDLDPNPGMSRWGCPYLAAMCASDNGDAHPPLGIVTFVDQNDVAIPGQSNTCATSGLGHQGARPTVSSFTGTTATAFGVPAPDTNQPEFASWCSVTMVLPPGTDKLAVTYNAESVPGPFSPHTPVAFGATQPIDIDLH